MNYFEIFSQGFQKALDVKDDQEFIKGSNTKEIKPFFQGLTNFLFNQWVLAKKMEGKDIYDKKFKVLSRTDFPDISDEYFEILNVLTVKRDFLYISNYESDLTDIDPYYHLFDFKGIIDSLRNFESDLNVFYVNKFHIINIIDTYLLGKYLDYYLRECAPTKYKRGYEFTNEHYYKKVFIKALTYKSKKINTYSDSFKETETKLAENAFYEYNKAILSTLISSSKEIGPDEFKKNVLYKCLYSYRNFRVEVLNEIRKYLITNEELEDNENLFIMTHRKRLLLYDLLRNIEPEKELPGDEKAFSNDRSISTIRFDDFKRNEVRKHFG